MRTRPKCLVAAVAAVLVMGGGSTALGVDEPFLQDDVITANLDGDAGVESVHARRNDGLNVHHRHAWVEIKDVCRRRLRRHTVLLKLGNFVRAELIDADGRGRPEVLARVNHHVVVVRLSRSPKEKCPTPKRLLDFDLFKQRVPPSDWRLGRFDAYGLHANEEPGLEIVTVARWEHATRGWEEHITLFAYGREIGRYVPIRAFARSSGIP